MKESIKAILEEIEGELTRAVEAYPAFNSAHEGFSVLNEEVDELWDHVRVKPKNRDAEAMQQEAIQIAAMALRFAYDVCAVQRGRK